MRTVLSEESTLLEAVRLLVPGTSNRTIRRILGQGRVRVNGDAAKIASRIVRAGDVIEVGRPETRRLIHGLAVLHEDDDILVICKPPSLLTVATLHERERTVHAYLRQYLRGRGSRRKLHIVHRLDKLASGILVFAKSGKAQKNLQEQFRRHSVQRRYWAIVEGRIEAKSGTIRSRLSEDSSRRMHSTEKASGGKIAVTHFRVIKRLPTLTALEVTLETGRKNQIRAHLSEIGHPIAGDRAYGSTGNPLKRLGLHAFILGFKHPSGKHLLLYQTPPPPEFRRYLGRKQAGGETGVKSKRGNGSNVPTR